MPVDKRVLAANLKRYRAMKGMSQTDLAAKAKISRLAYVRLESGNVTPRVDTLLQVAEALGTPVQDLLVPVRELSCVRFRADRTMTTRSELLVHLSRILDGYVEVEKVLRASNAQRFAELRRAVAADRVAPGPKRAIQAATRTRRALNLSPGELIRDVCGLLEDHGVKVISRAVASEGFFGLSVGESDGGPAVVVNTWDRVSVERWIFTAAHELGHLLLHLDAYDVAKRDEDSTEEDEADVFASHLLMPDEVFLSEWNDAKGLGLVDQVFKLKRIFRVSYRTVLHRIAAHAKEPITVWHRYATEYRARFGTSPHRTVEPRRLKPEEFRSPRPEHRRAHEPQRLLDADFVHDRLHRLVRQALDADKLSLSRAAEILGVDLSTMRRISASWID